ncbi:MAG: hypothetical protein APU95_04570 [Hadesarchaea archaeon YNP_N21]|nr:MAG: hypothetical protein APU95_04570 [Hadesarchaea archaeon YNP_N21]
MSGSFDDWTEDLRLQLKKCNPLTPSASTPWLKGVHWENELGDWWRKCALEGAESNRIRLSLPMENIPYPLPPIPVVQSVLKSELALITPSFDNYLPALIVLAVLGVAVALCPWPLVISKLEQAFVERAVLRGRGSPIRHELVPKLVFGNAPQGSIVVEACGGVQHWPLAEEPRVENGHLLVHLTVPEGVAGYSGKRGWLLLRTPEGEGYPLGVGVVEGQHLNFDLDLRALGVKIREGLLRPGILPHSIFLVRMES